MKAYPLCVGPNFASSDDPDVTVFKFDSVPESVSLDGKGVLYHSNDGKEVNLSLQTTDQHGATVFSGHSSMKATDALLTFDGSTYTLHSVRSVRLRVNATPTPLPAHLRSSPIARRSPRMRALARSRDVDKKRPRSSKEADVCASGKNVTPTPSERSPRLRRRLRSSMGSSRHQEAVAPIDAAEEDSSSVSSPITSSSSSDSSSSDDESEEQQYDVLKLLGEL